MKKQSKANQHKSHTHSEWENKIKIIKMCSQLVLYYWTMSLTHVTVHFVTIKYNWHSTPLCKQSMGSFFGLFQCLIEETPLTWWANSGNYAMLQSIRYHFHLKISHFQHILLTRVYFSCMYLWMKPFSEMRLTNGSRTKDGFQKAEFK